MCAMRLTGYADKFGVHPGETIKFYVNCDGPSEFKAEVVQMIHGDTNPRGPGFIERPIDTKVTGTYKGRKQIIHGGSYGYVENAPQFHVDSFTLQCWIWPTTPKTHPRYWKHGAQGLVTKWMNGQGYGKGYGLFINEQGCLELRINEHKVTTNVPIRDHAWHFVAASYNAATGEVVLYHEPQVVYALDPVIEPVKATIKTKIIHTPAPVALGAYVDRIDDDPLAKSALPSGVWFSGKYNGKIDSPRICNKALSRFEIEQMKAGAQPGLTERRNSGPTGALSEVIVAAWDFWDGIDTIVAKDNGPYRFDAKLVNCPTRALTGYNWSGQNFDWKYAKKEYGAIHFHDDDVDNARWEVDVEWDVPAEGVKSRFYALKVTTVEGDEDYIPFWVVPKIGKEQSKIAVMVPTISYMAYANEHVACNAGGAELFVYRVPIMQHQNMFLAEHREYGGSIYDTHTDGSGICLSSRLRPILSIRPKYDHFLAQAPWQYPADLHLIYWLETMGYEYDVITDEDVTYDGVARLEGYNVVITGSHPEHNSGTQLDALHNYTQRGGRLMYMGADAWYWVHSFHPAYEKHGRGVVTEMRRCESGIRTWRAEPGEYYHQGTGELGGMWRFRGRSLYSVAGVGMTNEGFDVSTYYSRTPDSLDPRVAWAFEGITYDEPIGNFGLVGGGCAGLELDIVDVTLGSPPHTLAVATSAGRHTEAYLLVMEDFGFNQQGLDGTTHPRVRGDIAFHETPNGGACFAFSSIAFCGSLPWNNGKNNVSTLVGNVLNRFMMDGPLPPPPADAIKHRGRADYESPALSSAT